MKKRISKKLIVLIIVLTCVIGASVMAYAYSSNPDLSYDNRSGYFFLCFEKEEVQEWVKIKCKVADGQCVDDRFPLFGQCEYMKQGYGYCLNVNHKKKIEMSIEGYYGYYDDADYGVNQIQNIYNVQLVDENGNKGRTAQYWMEKDYFDKGIEEPGVIYARLPLVISTNLEKGYYWNASIKSDDTSQDADNSNLNEKQLDQSTFSFSIDTNNVGMTAWGINDGDNHHCKIYLNQEEYPVCKINLDPNGGIIKYAGTAKSQMSKEDNYLVECKSHQWGYVLDKEFWSNEYKQFWTKVHALSDKKVFYLDDSVKYPKLDITAEKENNIFLGYYYNDVQIIDKNGQLQVDYDYFDSDVTITAKWEPIKYTVTYDRNTPTGSLSAEGGETPNSHHVYDVSSKLSENGFTLDGYTFTGWKWNNKVYGDSSNKGAINVINLTDVNGSTITMYAQWTPVDNIKYVVNHWKQKLYYNGTKDYTDSSVHDEDNYSLADTETLIGVVDEQVTPEVNQYIGFTSPSQITVKIKGDGSTVVNYYYTRNEYNVGEDDGNGGLYLICGTGIESTSGAGRYKYGETVYIDAEVQDGYTWYQWTGTIQAYKKDYMFYMPAYNVTLTANATPDKYKIYFDGNKLEYSLYSDLTLEITEKEVTYMQPLGELPVPTLKGARFDGWYTTRVSGGEQWTEDTLYPKVGTKMLYARWTDITEPEGDIEDSYICPFDGTNISFNCKDEGGSGLKAINLYRGTEVHPENIVTDNTLTVDIVNEEGNCYGILANSFKPNPDGDNYYTLEIIDNAGNTTTKTFELICGEPLTWQAKLWRLNKSYVMAGTSDSLVYWTDRNEYPRTYGDMTGFIQTDIEGHVDRIEYEFVDDRIPNIVTEIENSHENDTYTDNVQFTLPKERPGYSSYVKVKLYRNVGTSHETVDVRNLNFKIEKYDFSRIRTRIRVTSGMYIPENEKGHVPVY